MDQLVHALRTLRRNKRFATLAILSLAIAIALNTTMYSVLDAIVFPKLDIRAPGRLFHLAFYGDYRHVVPDQERLEGLRALTFYSAMTRSVPSFAANVAERGSHARPARVLTVAPNYFALVGNTPRAGRLLSEVDVASPTRPAVVSERFWKHFFPERSFVDTATFLLDGQPRSIVGILPHEADFPGAHTDIWQLPLPGQFTHLPYTFALLRVRDGVSLAEAQGELDGLAARISMRASGVPNDARFVIKSATQSAPLRNFHKALILAVVAVLLIACVNLANLQLARGVSRSRELATRAAIGASRRNIITQLLLESSWLAFFGLLIGVFLTIVAMRLVIASLPPALDEFLLRPQLSWRVFAASGVVTLACLALMGIAPAVQLSRVDINEVLKTGAGTGATRRKRIQYGTLVVVQIALALALLVGTTLLVRVAAQLQRMELRPGMERIVQGAVSIMPSGPDDRRTIADVSALIVGQTRAITTVADAATFQMVQPKNHMVTLDDAGGAPVEIGVGMYAYSKVSSSYLRTIGMEVVKGRDFQEGEFAEPSIIVDERTARYLWPGADPIGKLIKLGHARSTNPWLRVVGVARYFNYWAPYTAANDEARLAPRMGAMYVLDARDTTRIASTATGGRAARGMSLQLIVRGTTNVQRLPGLLQRTLPDPGRGIRLLYAEPLELRLGLDVMRQRQNFVSMVFLTFALCALGVAALGVYAIVSHSVSQRRREIGVRMAIGASATEIRTSVLREGNLLGLLGIALGLVLASQTVGLLQAFLRGEEDRYDSWLFAIAAVVLFAVILVATWVPARRAMRINPVEALRND
jgi:putative ABC transport system permease protein